MTKVRTKNLSPPDKEELGEYQNSKVKLDNERLLSRLEKNFRPNKKQQQFTQVIKDNTIIVCHGSAGTGKTATALYQGLQEAINHNKRLILIRPVFESASERVGFIPGDLEDKLAPHVKVFKYVLEELVGHNVTEELIMNRKVQFEVLNFLRGVTLHNSVIICDEAQNMTVSEMVLATTRIGQGSKIIFTGDFYQSDLRNAKGSIMEFADMIKEVDGVAKFTFTNSDVVRNPILVEVTKLWEEYKHKH